ncbi:MAG TPA: phytanoyl-CoA dioxygenase family protein [Candidatus Melainabacteria bacterium]|nr:phytanoyl-CoA dioxygenase family protein [Candidatus Melainabacteria bacterium]
MWIINREVRRLVARIEKCSKGGELDDLLVRLVRLLQVRCAHPAVVARYESYRTMDSLIQPMPVDAEGYVIGYDPLTQEADFVDCWRKYGIVVGVNVVPPELCAAAIARMGELMLAASDGKCDLNSSQTWSNMPEDSAGVPIASRGFFEVYHDDAIAQLRQSVRVYLHYVLIWGRADLWTTFDRLGIKLPGHEESKALPLHVDQNPNVHPDFRTVQGVLALDDCPAERGTFVGVAGSRGLFAMYASMAKNGGEYVEMDRSDPLTRPVEDRAQKFPLRRGSLVSWDSRTTHANSANVSDKTRYVAYISCGVSRQDEPESLAWRVDGFMSGLGMNKRDSYMHASKKPRFTNQPLLAGLRKREQLTALGRLLYGMQRYE